MSSDKITLKLTERKEIGKAVKALRREGFVPANIYERGKESRAVTAVFSEITKAYREAGKHNPVELDVEGKKYLAMIKDVDMNVAKNTLRHVGFHAVNKNELVEAEVPVRIDGEIPAEKQSLLVLQNLDTVMIEAIPANLPTELLVDGSLLAETGDKVTVADIILPKDVKMVSDPEVMVADVQVPKDQIAEANAALDDQKTVDDVQSEQGADDNKEEKSSES